MEIPNEITVEILNASYWIFCDSCMHVEILIFFVTRDNLIFPWNVKDFSLVMHTGILQ